MSTKEERKAKLRNRTRQGVDDRGQTGLGKKNVLDLSKGRSPMVMCKYEAEKGKSRVIDILPFIISMPWYKDLRAKSGRPTGLDIGDWDYKLEIPVHKGVGPENEIVLCRQQAFGKRCPLCEDLFSEWEKDEEDQDEEKIKQLKSSWRCFYNVYDYDSDHSGVELMGDVSYFLFEDMLIEAMETDNEGLATFWDLDDGKSVRFKTREKKLGKNTFHEAHSIEFVARDPYDETILQETHPLDKMLRILSYDEIAEIYHGGSEAGSAASNEPETDGESEAEPQRQRRRPGARPARPAEKGEPAASPEKDSAGEPDAAPTESRRQRRRPGTDQAASNEPEKDGESEAEPQRQRRRPGARPAEDKAAKCAGFGKDLNNLPACDNCPQDVYDQCALAMAGGDDVPF